MSLRILSQSQRTDTVPHRSCNTQQTLSEMAKHFWGYEECVTASSVKKLLEGREVFAILFDQVPTPAGYDLYLWEHFTGGHGRWAVCKHFDEDVLSQSAFKKAGSLTIARGHRDVTETHLLITTNKILSDH